MIYNGAVLKENTFISITRSRDRQWSLCLWFAWKNDILKTEDDGV